MTRTEYFNTLLSMFEEHIEATEIEKEKELEEKILTFIFNHEIQDNLKEIAHFYGGWDKLKELVNSLEENEQEAAWERSQERLMEDGGYSQSGEIERMAKIQRELK